VDQLVVAVEDGVVVAIDLCFTGGAESPWWNQTAAVLVEGASGVVLYGEVEAAVKVGDHLLAGDPVGVVRQVLRERPGKSYPNPASMLHLELYATGTRAAVWWRPGEAQPAALRDPTDLLRGALCPDGIVPAGVVVLRDDEGKVLLLRRYLHDRNMPGLSLPGGQVEEGESLPDALRREVREETGLEVRFRSYAGAYRTGWFDVHAVHGVIEGGELRAFPSPEHEAAMWVAPTDALSMDLAGSMTRAILQALVAVDPTLASR